MEFEIGYVDLIEFNNIIIINDIYKVSCVIVNTEQEVTQNFFKILLINLFL